MAPLFISLLVIDWIHEKQLFQHSILWPADLTLLRVHILNTLLYQMNVGTHPFFVWQRTKSTEDVFYGTQLPYALECADKAALRQMWSFSPGASVQQGLQGSATPQMFIL